MEHAQGTCSDERKKSIRSITLTGIIAGLIVFFGMQNESSQAAAPEKIIIGAVEEITLPSGVTVPARIDTGAATSSLDVCDYTVRHKMVDFTLSDRCGGLKFSLPLAGWRYIQSTEGGERRPIVEMEICLASRRVRVEVSLNDRSRLEYPFLVGRNMLDGNFIVDVSRAKVVSPPFCPDGKSP